jgi:hypothetical protein
MGIQLEPVEDGVDSRATASSGPSEVPLEIRTRIKRGRLRPIATTITMEYSRQVRRRAGHTSNEGGENNGFRSVSTFGYGLCIR